MNVADIPAWLASGQDFAQGAALYAALGTSKAYQRLFALGATEYSRQVLVRALSALVPPEPAPDVHSPAPEPVLLAPVALPPQADHRTLAALDDVRRQLRAVRDERSHLHPQLTARGMSRTKRQQLAGRIIDLTDQELVLKATEAHVLQHGRLPGPVPTADVTDPRELQRRLLNLRSRRSKLRKDPARAVDLEQVEAAIELITQKLHL